MLVLLRMWTAEELVDYLVNEHTTDSRAGTFSNFECVAQLVNDVQLAAATAATLVSPQVVVVPSLQLKHKTCKLALVFYGELVR